MIDTIRLAIAYEKRPAEWINTVRQMSALDVGKGTTQMNINPSKSYKMAGVYLPRMTYMERPSRGGKTYTLYIELSLPKLIFNNNFNELSDTDFDTITKELSSRLANVYNLHIPPAQLARAKVNKVHYSKNIVFTDYTPIVSITKSMGTADISRVYDTQNTNFRNGGHVYHMHTNSLDVAMYDKIADLKQEKISPKRSQEKDGYTQISLIDQLERNKSTSVARFEVRLNTARMIKRELETIGVFGGLTFQELYRTNISRRILLRHWNNIFNRIPKAHLDTDTPEQLLLNIKRENPDMVARETLAIVGLKLLESGQEARYIRSLLDGLFPAHQYRRLQQKGREPPALSQLKALMSITRNLTTMTPVSINNYI